VLQTICSSCPASCDSHTSIRASQESTLYVSNLSPQIAGTWRDRRHRELLVEPTQAGANSALTASTLPFMPTIKFAAPEAIPHHPPLRAVSVIIVSRKLQPAKNHP
jgi:hypothetical protein